MRMTKGGSVSRGGSDDLVSSSRRLTLHKETARALVVRTRMKAGVTNAGNCVGAPQNPNRKGP
jgi:hypothetical protein